MKVKLDAADIAFSKFIRERDEWTCQRCGTHDPDGPQRKGSHKVQCSHIFPRGNQSTRFYSINAKTLCFNCHNWFGSTPVEAARWVKDYLGSETLEELEKRARQVWPRTKKEKKEIAKHWRAQTEYLIRCREEGIEFHVSEWD